MITKAQFYQSLKKSKCYIHFSDGKSFTGYLNREASELTGDGIWGEAAFTTGMSGYQETMTDPSFLGQHIIFTSAEIGNYEYDPRVSQSNSIHASAIVARNISYNDFLAKENPPIVTGIDTRSLVKYLTTISSDHKSIISLSSKAPSKDAFQKAQLNCNELSQVSQDKNKIHIPGDNPIVVINYGIKNAIINNLEKFGLPLVSVPHTVTANEIEQLAPRLIFLSNGPGDPREYKNEISVVKELLKLNIPLRGICLGHQLLGLALGQEIIKLPFGQRGINHPLLDHETGQVLISSQNHGYAIDYDSLLNTSKNNSLDKEIYVTYSSLFDQSVEGMATKDQFLRSVQFHPEANPGPMDAEIFFEEIEGYLNGKREVNLEHLIEAPVNLKEDVKKDIPYKKILIIGSGPIKIGQASEFDYSGTQACKSLKQLGIDVVLLNSNPATIMTDTEMAYRTYIEPITKDTIKKIVEKEKVDAVLSTMGGQTALNICVELEEDNYFKSVNVALLGANVDTINKTEDRDLFAKELDGLGYQTGKRYHAHSKADALTLAEQEVGFPLIIRRDFALGGKGAALVYNLNELEETFSTDIKFPITMEKSLVGYKEIELEVMVDKDRNGVIICSIENIDPCGIHTGDSITVAPAQTISDRCYQQLRTIALTVAKHMGVVAGGANVQFAINPHDEDDIVVIEMNPRVSRSSALASKATGYPIAKISAMLSVGFTLTEILNDITKASPVAFEPTLDYVAVKIPIFPFNKFPTSSKVLGPQMRSVGEVLSLGGSFIEAFMKALRSLEMGLEIPELTQLKSTPFDMDWDYIHHRLKNPYQLSLLTVIEALRMGKSVKELFNITNITPWFIEKVKDFVEQEKALGENPELIRDKEKLVELKQMGFSDKYLGILTNQSLGEILDLRHRHKAFPIYKAVDTCSGEFDAKTPYFYSTYTEENEAAPLSDHGRSIATLGSGPNRIGQGIEFDYSCVKACGRLKEKGIKAIMINSNPETVSTDYDSSDRLYLSPLFSEDLFDIFLNEKPEAIITSFSGQTGINIREHLEAQFRKEYMDLKFLGPSLDTLALTEDRNLFSELTKKTDLSQTTAKEIRGHKNLLTAMSEIGFPVIIRPSYVIGGESMYIFRSRGEIDLLPAPLREGLQQSSTTFQVENYLENANEYDVDLIRDQSGNCVFSVCEHIEHAGVHSGDSGMITPPVRLTQKVFDKLKTVSIDLANKLEIVGPINIQFAIKGEDIYCIEANPRGSRTIPFLSKACQVNLPGIAVDALLGEVIEAQDVTKEGTFCVKQSTFPFDRFVQDNIILGPKMRSTGETLGIDRDKDMAILKSYLGNYPDLSKKGKILFTLADHSKSILIPYLKQLHKIGYEFLGTKGNCEYIKQQGLPCQEVSKIGDDTGLSLLEALKEDDIRMVFNTPLNQGSSKSDGEHIRNTAIQYAVPCFTREENIKAVVESILGVHGMDMSPLAIQEL